MKKCFVTALIFGMVLTLSARAEDSAVTKEIDRLEQRIEELEKQQEADKTESSETKPSSGIARHVSIGGVLSGAYQYEWIDGPPDIDDQGRGALSFQPEISITPSETDEIFFKFGFAAGNGLNDITPFNLRPWAADLEDDVKNIGGRNRDYLLTAWYKHTFEFSASNRLGLTGGLIDSTNYLDQNAYSNDQYSQFMNVALVNSPNAFLPSYDIGGALEWDYRQFGITAVYMNVGENDDGNNFNFYGFEFMYTLDTSLGEGHYRVIYNFSNDAFLDPGGTSLERRDILILSFDQPFGEIFGAWIRFALGSEKASVDYRGLYSGGINIRGKLWGRDQDNLGIGYAYVDGAEQTAASIRSSQVAEAYVNFGLKDYLSLTFDLQYMDDQYASAASQDDVNGLIAGIRATVAF